MGRRWTHYKAEHFFYFNRRSIERLAARCGLEFAHFGRLKKSLNLHYLHSQLTVYRHGLMTPVTDLLNRVLPARLMERNFKIRIGGIVVLLKKPVYSS